MSREATVKKSAEAASGFRFIIFVTIVAIAIVVSLAMGTPPPQEGSMLLAP
jgi:hypothetical protein